MRRGVFYKLALIAGVVAFAFPGSLLSALAEQGCAVLLRPCVCCEHPGESACCAVRGHVHYGEAGPGHSHRPAAKENGGGATAFGHSHRPTCSCRGDLPLPASSPERTAPELSAPTLLPLARLESAPPSLALWLAPPARPPPRRAFILHHPPGRAPPVETFRE